MMKKKNKCNSRTIFPASKRMILKLLINLTIILDSLFAF